MSKPSIADIGWHELLIEQLEGALKLSRAVLSDLEHIAQCDGANCGRMFDDRDPRSAKVKQGTVYLQFCPGCNLEAQIEADRKENGNGQ